MARRSLSVGRMAILAVAHALVGPIPPDGGTAAAMPGAVLVLG